MLQRKYISNRSCTVNSHDNVSLGNTRSQGLFQLFMLIALMYFATTAPDDVTVDSRRVAGRL